jgi:E3 ubiquitin-protein ligase BRE1
MKAEAEARRQLSEAKRELARYQSAFGDLSALSADVRTLSQQLLQKEDEIKRLRLLDTQRAQVGCVLFSILRDHS